MRRFFEKRKRKKEIGGPISCQTQSSSTAPIDNIPPDVLQEILLLACDGRYFLPLPSPNLLDLWHKYLTHSHLPIERADSPLPFQHTLAAVSRRWKSIVMSFPALWANIHIRDGGELTSPSPSRHVAPLTTALRCVGEALMSCDIELSSEGGPSPAILKLLEILIRSSKQWVSLRLYGCRTLPHVFLPLYRNIPLLQSLHCNLIDGTERALIHIFSEAPSLVDVNVDIRLWGKDHVFIFPWSQIRRATLVADDPPLPYLQNLARLSPLKFFQYHDFTSALRYTPRDTLTLFSVEEMHIVSYQLLSLIVLPSLRTATITPSQLDIFKVMVSKSGCRIQVLNLVNHRGSFPPMDDLEYHLPSLARLKMHGDIASVSNIVNRDLKMLFTELGFLWDRFLGLEELCLMMPCGELWNRQGLVRLIDFVWDLVSARRYLRRFTLRIMFSINGVHAREHVRGLEIGCLDKVDSFRKLKEVHALKAPSVDLTMLYEGVGFSQEVQLPMDRPSDYEATAFC